MSDPVLFAALGTPNPDHPKALQDYAAKAPPILEAHGAKPRLRSRLVAPLLGEGAPGTIFVAEFPSEEALRRAFDDPGYKALIPLRDKAFADLRFMILEEIR